MGVTAQRMVLAEDDVLLREGLSSLLDRSGVEVVGQAGDATELLAVVRDRRPDLVQVQRGDDPLAVLSPREGEVLEQMAEGRSTAGTARRLWVTEGTVEKHVRSILGKLSLSDTDDDHGRVLAMVTHLEAP